MNKITVIYLLLGQALANLTIFFIVMSHTNKRAKKEGYIRGFIDCFCEVEKLIVKQKEKERREIMDKMKKKKCRRSLDK